MSLYFVLYCVIGLRFSTDEFYCLTPLIECGDSRMVDCTPKRTRVILLPRILLLNTSDSVR